MIQYYMNEVSANKKTGPIPVSTISKRTCPDACVLKNGHGCYAENFPMSNHWNKVTNGERGTDFAGFLERVRRLPKGVWRHAQAGDLPGEGDEIDYGELQELATANRNRPVIAFTHKPLTPSNLSALRDAESKGFHINLSANSMSEVDDLRQSGHSVVTVMSSEYGRKMKGKFYVESISEYRERTRKLNNTTNGGTRVAVCPATYMDVTCQQCSACSKRRPNDVVIGFPAHGAKARTIDRGIVSEINQVKGQANYKDPSPPS